MPSKSGSNKVDLSPIKQKHSEIKTDNELDVENQMSSQYNIKFQETDEDLQDKLQNLFKGREIEKDFEDQFDDENDGIEELDKFIKGDDNESAKPVEQLFQKVQRPSDFYDDDYEDDDFEESNTD
jgi:hypothetical protein